MLGGSNGSGFARLSEAGRHNQPHRTNQCAANGWFAVFTLQILALSHCCPICFALYGCNPLCHQAFVGSRVFET